MQQKKYTQFGRKFRTALRQRGWGLKNFSELSGIKIPTIGNYSRGANVPDGENREKVQRLLQLHDADFLPDTLNTSDGRMGVIAATPPKRRVPIVSWAKAGSMQGGGAFEDLANQIEDTVETDSRDVNCFAIEIDGDSMEPFASHGDKITLEPNREAPNGYPVLVKLIDGRVFFKRLYKTGEKVVLQSENTAYADMEFPLDQIAFVYPTRDIIKTANSKPMRK